MRSSRKKVLTLLNYWKGFMYIRTALVAQKFWDVNTLRQKGIYSLKELNNVNGSPKESKFSVIHLTTIVC